MIFLWCNIHQYTLYKYTWRITNSPISRHHLLQLAAWQFHQDTSSKFSIFRAVLMMTMEARVVNGTCTAERLLVPTQLLIIHAWFGCVIFSRSVGITDFEDHLAGNPHRTSHFLDRNQWIYKVNWDRVATDRVTASHSRTPGETGYICCIVTIAFVLQMSHSLLVLPPVFGGQAWQILPNL